MSNPYYQAIDKMEKQGVDAEYINGWACGYLHNPKREEQRVTPAYDAGYQDGWDKKGDNFKSWVKQ